MTATVCLNMIVKNEAHVLARCLASVRPFVHAWAIVDTGSTDGTQELVRRELASLPGELVERPWKDFGHNRTEALELARGKADYVLILDADEQWVVPPGFVMPALTADQYTVVHRQSQNPAFSWALSSLVRAALPWRYVGVLHEVILCEGAGPAEELPGPVIVGHFDSARNVEPLLKYARDAEVLERALRDEPDNARYVFYLAQSYRDSNQHERALEAYERRVALGGWGEETFYSALQIALLGERSGWPWPRCLEAYLRAFSLRPVRAEPLCALAAHYRLAGDYAVAELFARAAASIPRPNDVLFVDDSVYAWRALDELAIAAYYVGKRGEAHELNERLLREGYLPEADRARVEKNLGFCSPPASLP